jgi:hypothetical protein
MANYKKNFQEFFRQTNNLSRNPHKGIGISWWIYPDDDYQNFNRGFLMNTLNQVKPNANINVNELNEARANWTGLRIVSEGPTLKFLDIVLDVLKECLAQSAPRPFIQTRSAYVPNNGFYANGVSSKEARRIVVRYLTPQIEVVKAPRMFVNRARWVKA